MYTGTIDAILNELPGYGGCFARDKLPLTVEYPSGFVINTHKHSQPGEHWVTVYLRADGIGEFFDSYGTDVLHPEIKAFLKEHCPRGYFFNKTRLQTYAPFSVSCGQYCVLYLAFRLTGVTSCLFFELFSSNPFLNEILVRLYTLI